MSLKKFLLLSLIQIVLSQGDPLVVLPNGQIQGRTAVTIENKSFYAFEKIPYATPPSGDLRFKAPQPAKNWDGVLITTHLDVVCFQIDSNSDSESEDCLYINVFTPQLPSEDSNASLPVMLFIYGGGFADGSSQSVGPDLLVNNDVILVTFDYRVGLFGFLSTQDEVIPGNNGLKDQKLAIQWTHDNIHLFGGDPNKITIFGQSAGSASVAYQLLNQDNNGLFRGAILESGTFLSIWALQPRAREIAFATAALLNSTFETSNDSQALLEFLLLTDARDLDTAARNFLDFGSLLLGIERLFYLPVIEAKNPDAFLTRKMFGLLQAGNIIAVPVLMGMNSEETLVYFPDTILLEAASYMFDRFPETMVLDDMQISNVTERAEMGRKIQELYTGGEPFFDHLGHAVGFTSDTFFTRSIIKHAKLYSRLAKTYFYQFSYDGEMGNVDIHYDGAGNVAHGEELSYLLCSGSGCDDSAYPESDRITRQRLVKIWTDFAKYLNPTPEPSELLQNITWPVVFTDEGNFYYVDINENLEIRNHPKGDTFPGWEALYDSLDYSDFDTY